MIWTKKERRKSHYFLLTKRFLPLSCDICWRPHLWGRKKKYVQQKGEKLSSEALRPDQAWLDCFFLFFFFFCHSSCPGDASQTPTDLPQFPTVNLNRSPLSHLLSHSHPLLCRCAHLFILNPVIIVPLHWPAGKALLKVGELIEHVSLTASSEGCSDWLHCLAAWFCRQASFCSRCLPRLPMRGLAEDVLSAGLHLSIRSLGCGSIRSLRREKCQNRRNQTAKTPLM